MQCPQCQTENLPDSRFCTQCGARLDPACPTCGTSNPPSARFCRQCGSALSGTARAAASPAAYTPRHLAEKILTSRSALQGERKQVTVLFADVKGSMDLAEQVDPETWHTILDRFFAILADGVHRFEGTVNQYTGDGIMALFGAPIAHEDHARRACFAALHLTDALARYAAQLRRRQGLNFSVRMGLNSGEVIVGAIGDDLRLDYTAQGHTVGLAQRMEQLAEPGKAYLTETTAALVTGFFRLRDLGSFTVKGVREPIRVYELRGVGPLRTRLDVSRARGFSRFVGREAETALLDEALERSLAGDAQVVSIVGDPGVGKSRLCYELLQQARARRLAVYETHGVPHGTMVPFLPVLELLRAFFGVTEQDSDETARDKIAGRLVRLDEELGNTSAASADGEGDPENQLLAVVKRWLPGVGRRGETGVRLRDALPLVFEFLGVPDREQAAPRMEPETRQKQLFAIMKHLLHARARREPVVILVEDLQWIDGGSAAFLENLVDVLPGTRTLLLVNFRPEYPAGWLVQPYHRQLALEPLGPEAIGEMLRELLGTDPSLAGLAARVRERTGGNPFFIEEVLQALVESGSLAGTKGAYRLARPVDQVAIPATVQAVLAARIDRLGERDKAVLQTAAVIGKHFSRPVLERVVGLAEPELASALQALIGAEFLYEEAMYPEAEYAFKHPLTQEVAYRSQLAESRAHIHAAVARVMEELYADKLDQRAALLAHHREGAGELLPAARWSRRAAEWTGTSDPAEARRHWRKARALLQSIADSAETRALGLAACTALLNLGWRLGIGAEEAAVLYADGKALAEQVRDLHATALLVSAHAAVEAGAGDLERAHAHNVEALELAERTDDEGLKLALRNRLVLTHLSIGHLREVLTFADDALARASEGPPRSVELLGYNPYTNFMRLRGLVLAEFGRLAEAARDLDRALELAREQGDEELVIWTHLAEVLLAERYGDAPGALAHARQAVELAERIGTPYPRAQAYCALGAAHLLAGDWNGAAAAIEPGLSITRARRIGLQFEALMLAMLARARSAQGDHALARATADEGVAAVRRHGTKLWACTAQLALAEVLLAGEGAAAREAIAAALDETDALVVEMGAESHRPFIHVERAALAKAIGDKAGRRRELRRAQELFTAMGATVRAAAVAAALDR
jgi:class 3 adenylate cyclase/tetratricopeptide (TPR) repeat protein